jgi:hypothetical protein
MVTESAGASRTETIERNRCSNGDGDGLRWVSAFGTSTNRENPHSVRAQPCGHPAPGQPVRPLVEDAGDHVDQLVEV